MGKKRPTGELIIPPAAIADERSVEMLRLWIAGGALHCSLNIGHWQDASAIEEEEAWGKVLADAIQHIASAIRERQGKDRKETIRRIFKALEDELAEPTTKHRGKFVRTQNDADV
jgi:hypothetical protein